MGGDLSPQTLLQFIESDFESAWDSLAENPTVGGRGNFMFAMQTMILLEVACRLCGSDTSGSAHNAFSSEIAARDRRYFTSLPGPCFTPKDFRLPHVGSDPASELIAALFDLIRNGHAHQYQQIRVQLNDGIDFQVSLTGASFCAYLSRTLAEGRPSDHLSMHRTRNGDIWIIVRPDVLYLDFRESIRAANLLGRGLCLKYISRPKIQSQRYQFSGSQLVSALSAAGH